MNIKDLQCLYGTRSNVIDIDFLRRCVIKGLITKDNFKEITGKEFKSD